MRRSITLFTGQWADLPLEVLGWMASEWGYDGLELACWGDHFDVEEAAANPDYCKGRHELLAKYGLKVWAIGNHLAGQLVLDPNNDERSDGFAPSECAGDAEKKRAWAIESMKLSAKAARNLGVNVVNGFTGSSIWHLASYFFPPVPPKDIEEGFKLFAQRWNPILDVFSEFGVKFALEVHPTEIAFDLISAQRAIEAIDGRPEFGFNFDPSHLHWQGIDPVRFIEAFSERIYHVHMKDVIVNLDGINGILCSYLPFGDPRRGWDFRGVGRGDINFEAIICALNNIGYQGPLSVEFEDITIDRVQGAKDACKFIKDLEAV